MEKNCFIFHIWVVAKPSWGSRFTQVYAQFLVPPPPPPNKKAIALRSADQNTTSLNSFSFNTPASQSTVMGLPDGALLDALYNV